MAYFAAPLENLIEKLCVLPGIGPKSAQRIAFFLLSIPRTEAVEIARAIVEAKDKIRFCSTCFNIAEGELCSICSDGRRDESIICAVEEPRDVIAIEKSGRFKGKYHVLGGAISPIDGVGPEELRIRELIGRLREGKVTELITATNPNAEGEATALYLAQLVRPLGVRVTRIARGLPVGGDLEYADEVTLGRALDGRSEI
ncbi:MAG: recombination protein RecR [Candidatus Anoxymicrobium japonicum]|uniref:Recombination protein RecR n=1 Tax=Candidatus Anoxymicrobium japonicum TaxID=2013648 RepID=A0A2N3G759_9ACTN|nr:MAG: recombination protein RecR [Candidatus Anoxymicrobium japonicum]